MRRKFIHRKMENKSNLNCKQCEDSFLIRQVGRCTLNTLNAVLILFGGKCTEERTPVWREYWFRLIWAVLTMTIHYGSRQSEQHVISATTVVVISLQFTIHPAKIIFHFCRIVWIISGFSFISHLLPERLPRHHSRSMLFNPLDSRIHRRPAIPLNLFCFLLRYQFQRRNNSHPLNVLNRAEN